MIRPGLCNFCYFIIAKVVLNLWEEAIRGIEPQIKGLVKAGVLQITENLRINTPLLPVGKPDGSYRLVHDLRAAHAG